MDTPLITFSPHPTAERASRPLRLPPTGVASALKALVNGPLPEASGHSSKGQLLSVRGNPFLATVAAAYNEHYPLVLSPDHIWLCIAQGFANHVVANAEPLRDKFVQHQGKALIVIEEDSFVKGSPDNDWQGTFGKFSDAIAKSIGKTRDLVVSDFSTTGPVERAASEVVLMDAMSPYFEYMVRTLCGFPEVTLLGTVEDWRSIRARVAALAEYDLGWWTSLLLPVLDRIVETAEGSPNLTFWRSMYQQGGGSGGPFVNGWVNVLFPYVLGRGGTVNTRNSKMCTWDEDRDFLLHGLNPDSFGAGVSKVAFKWDYHGAILDMDFLAGFVGIDLDPATNALRPAIGWGVRDAISGSDQSA